MSTPTNILLSRELFDLALEMTNTNWKLRLTERVFSYTDKKVYFNFLQYCMVVAVLRSRGYVEVRDLNRDLFKDLSKYKGKLLFEVTVEPETQMAKLTKVVYDEKPDRMGLWIRRTLCKTFHAYGFAVNLEEKFSRNVEKSFFIFG